MKLSKESKTWYDSVKEAYSIEDEAGLLLLGTVAESVDLMRSAQRSIDKDGLIIKDRYGSPKPHPGATIIRDAKSSIFIGLKALNLDLEPLKNMK